MASTSGMKSTMFGFLPRHASKADPEAVAVIDPTASVDPQTGAVIEKKSMEERKFVARLDAILLLYGCISQVIKYLDQQNISAAYVSGMKEDLRLNGNQYNYFTTYFNVGYAVFLIPSQVIITRVRPSYWLPALEFCWGLLTLSVYKVTSAKQLYVIRTFTGVFEASAYPGTVMLLMSWYTPREIAFRIGFYHSCQSIGNMLAGALQAAIYTNLNGVNGIAGWRWMFIIDGIITMILSLVGFMLLPDFPSKPNPRAFWLRPRHIAIACERTNRFRRSDNKKFTLSTIKRALRQPLFYAFGALYPTCVLAQQGYNYFNLWLKSLTNADGSPVWSIAQLNTIPIGGNAIAVSMVWFWAFISDYYQTRWLVVMFQAILGIVPSSIMTAWNVPIGAKYFSFFATFLSLATAPPLFAWLSDLSPHDAEQRAFILGWSIAFYYAVGAWSNVLIWPADEAPHYKAGWKVSIGLWILAAILLCTLRYIELRFIRPRNQRIAEEKALDQITESEGGAVDDGPDKKDDGVQQVVSVH